ncbi:MAG: hypothetical protein LBI45_09540 [Bacteroidales bacterium]|jgi:hypothetical protein|nr:hypothetical protein [Bacteroidales bacterium]
METQQVLPRFLPHLVFKVYTTFVFLFIFSSCFKPNPEKMNEIKIINATNDTIVFAENNSKANYCYYFTLRPNEYRSMSAYDQGIYEMIIKNYQEYGTIIEIYKPTCSTCNGVKVLDAWAAQDSFYIEKSPLVSWKPPLLTLSDSIHSFYNFNSWMISAGGKKNKWDRAVFTITKDDFETN